MEKRKHNFLIISLLFYFSLNSCAFSTQIEKLNKDIINAQKILLKNGSLKNEIIASEFNRLRKIFLNKLPIDTLSDKKEYILFESFDSQSAIYQMFMYNMNITYEFKYFAPNDSLIINKTNKTYSNFIISNILNENFEKIKERQTEQGFVTGGVRVYVYLIKYKNDILNIKPFYFDEFHDAISDIPLH